MDLDSFLFRYKFPILALVLGGILIGLGVLVLKSGLGFSPNKIEVIEPPTESGLNKEIVIELSGGVENPGVYKLPEGSRIEDALVAAGGLSSGADRVWVEKSVNRASKLIDGQKVYIAILSQHLDVLSAKSIGEYQNASSTNNQLSGSLINLNSASLNELDTLPGIGQVLGQKIIDNRPYSDINELVSKKIIGASTFSKFKDKISVY